MAALAMTPKLLGRISNEKYQEEDKWKIDDIGLGPANELLISGHNLEKPTTFISLHKKDDGKYDNCPEFNRNFRQPQPGEQLALFLEGSSIIGLKVENALRIVSIENKDVVKTLKLKRSPKCICFYRGKLYAASSSPTSVSVCNSDLEDKSNIILSDMGRDRVLEIVVVMEKIYVCTKNDGRALVFSMTGSKEMEFKNPVQTDAMATSICIHERTELVFVLWNNIQIQLYSQKNSRCLRTFDMAEELHKIRVTTEHILVTLNASKCIVTVYDVGEAIKFGERQNTILSSVKKKHRKKLISHDGEDLESHPADFETLPSPWKSASKQSKVEKLRDMKQLEENENLGRQYDSEVQKIYDATLELTNQKNDVTKELKKEQSIWTKKEKDCLQLGEELHTAISQKMDLAKTVTKTEELYQIIDAKEKHIQQLRMRLKKTQTEMENAKTQVIILQNKKEELVKSVPREQRRAKELKTLLSNLNERIQEQEGIRRDLESQQQKVKDSLVKEKIHVVKKLQIVEDRNTKLEAEVTQFKKRLPAKEKALKELQTSSLKLNERIKELEFTRKNMESQQQKLKDNLVQEKQKVAREERSRVQLNERIKELEFSRKKLESQVKKLKDNLVQEKRKVTREKRSHVQLKERVKELEFTRKKLESQQKKLKDNLVQEKRKVSREEKSRVQMVANLKKVEKRNKKLENAMTQLKERLLAEGKTAKKLQTASPKILETQEDDKRIPRDENLQGVMHSMKGNIKRLGEEFCKSKAVLNGLEKSTVEQEADNMQLPLELSYVSDDTILQTGQESVSLMVESAFDEMEEEVMKLEEKIEKLEGSLSKKEASFKALDTSNKKLSEECERLSKEVALARFPSDSSKFGVSQRHDRDPYWFNDADPAISESMDSGVTTSNLETDDCLSGLCTENLDQFCPELKVAVTVSSKGTQMLIPDTGVELYVPGGSLLSRQLIELKVIDFDNDKFDALFSLDSNSSVAVQLLPNKATLRWPARLRLPHCLRLKENFQELKSHVKIYRSEHAPGQDAQWEHDPELKYELKDDCCIIFVKKFCSLRYDVIDEAIDATKVTVFTSGKQHGTSMELTVGYHVDLPGRREMLLTMNNDMKIFKAKPFEFVKESTDTLQVHLTTAVSRAQSYEKTTTEVDGKLSVFEAAAKIAELPLDRPKPLHVSDASHFEGNEHISTAMLKVSETVSNKGTTMRILDTGIELAIPPNALKGYQYIEMSVVPSGTLDEPISTFSSNSSVIVELLPNRATFSTPVRLSLPHCLKLKKGFSKRSVKVYLSHHEKDQKPFWEELPDAKYELKADHCVIYLTSFCWVKYEIDNKIVVAKRIKVYTATRGMERNDQIAEVEVGYFIDMPGRAENLRENVDLKISQCKPLLFFKEGNLPLQIFHIKVLPMFWKYSTPERNPKVIQYKSIADSVDTSLPFVFEKQDANKQKPFVMFRVSQGNEEVEINIRL